MISVDAKKKEQVGQYASGGREWRPKGDPVQVRDHDFPGPGSGKVTPYGIYDLGANAGWVNVGTDRDTAAFAVESIRRWWHARGRERLPRRAAAADHRRRRRVQRLPDPGLEDRAGRAGRGKPAWRSPCCHFPPGTSQVEQVRMAWRPPRSDEMRSRGPPGAVAVSTVER